MKLLYRIVPVFVALVVLASCGKDFLNPDMTQYATQGQIEEVLKDETASAAYNDAILLGAFAIMSKPQHEEAHDVISQMSLTLSGDLMTEDMIQMANHYYYFDYEIDNRNATYRRTTMAWSYLYTLISQVNQIIGKIPVSTTDAGLKPALGQALALRAFALHTLVQRFQQTYKGNENALGVPIPLTELDDEESVKGRTTVEKVYERIEKDLTNAYTLLSGYQRPSKIYLDSSVVAGFLARMYMVKEEWGNAETYANIARQGYTLMSPEDCLKEGYNDLGGKEWMWGSKVTGQNTNIFASFSSHICSVDEGYGGPAVGAYKAIDAKLYFQIGANDVRRQYFKDPMDPIIDTSDIIEERLPSYVNLKFKKVDGWLADDIYMRVAEMYLIEAEAQARQSKAQAAQTLADLMIQRDPTWSKAAVTAEDVFLQKRIELWGEGVIFYDYLRLKKGVNRDYSGTNHLVDIALPAGSWRFIYQVPQTELDSNSGIGTGDQNP